MVGNLALSMINVVHQILLGISSSSTDNFPREGTPRHCMLVISSKFSLDPVFDL